MDKVVSEKIATKIIFSLYSNASSWEKGHDEAGEFISSGVIKVLIDTHEIYISCATEGHEREWKQLTLNEKDILRVHDVVYDICNEPNWIDIQADPIRSSLEALKVD